MVLETAQVQRAPRQRQDAAQDTGFTLPVSADRNADRSEPPAWENRFALDGGGEDTDIGSIPVAAAVDEGEENQVASLPRAKEYHRSRSGDSGINRNKRVYKYVLSFLCVVSIISATVLGVVFLGIDNAGGSSSASEDNRKYREGLGIRKKVVDCFPQADLDTKTSPYHRALEWITYKDPSEPHPDDSNFIQRYTLAYFYFATTERGPWKSCNPPSTEAGEDTNCAFYYFPNVYTEPAQDSNRNYEAVVSASFRWLSKAHECSWAGCFCDDNEGVVIGLMLAGAGLSGTFPEGVQQLSNLELLNLAFGEFTGPLFPELGKMSHLAFVEIQYNGFTGEIPQEWWEASNWQELNVGSNFLEGTIPTEVSSLVSMTYLALHENMFEGEIPSEIALPNLWKASLFNNAFRGHLPSPLMTATMEDLYLGKNLFSGAIPTEIARMSNVKDITFSNNHLSGSLIEDIYQLSSLVRLDVHGCNLSGTISHLVGNLDKLVVLLLGDNNFSGKIPEELGSCTDLTRLRLHGNRFTGVVPETVCSLRYDDGLFYEVYADCLATTRSNDKAGGGETTLEPLLSCPHQCCTVCCDQNGFCVDVST